MYRPGYIAFNRAAYEPRQMQPGTVELLPPPREPATDFISRLLELSFVIGGVVGMAVALISSFAFSPWIGLLMAMAGVISIVFGVLNLINNKRKNARELQLYIDDLTQKQELISQLNEEFVRRLHQIDPAPSNLSAAIIASGRGRYLWERQEKHQNFLKVRIGVEPMRPSHITIEVPPAVRNKLDKTELDQIVLTMQEQLQIVQQTPGLINLREAEVFGIAGPRQQGYELACALLCQIAVHHSPEDVRLMFFYHELVASSWFWAGWLPHTQPLDSEFTRPYLSGDSNDAKELNKTLRELIDRRQSKTRSGNDWDKANARHPYIIVFIDDYNQLAIEPGLMQRLFREGPPLNIFSIFLSTKDEALPSEALGFVDIMPNRTMRLVINPRNMAPIMANWQADQLTGDAAEKIARELAPLQLPQAGRGFTLPNSVNFFDLLGWKNADAQYVINLWQDQKEANLKLMLGVRDNGEPLLIDLEENVHGTHGVVAGATGTGKGELLMTLITSLALNNHPSRLNFVLADFKGGATFRVFNNLPHTVGLVTDEIDEFGLNRFLTSIRSELDRRKTIIDEAQRTYGSRVQKLRDLEKIAPEKALPFLLVVIDEFAELARSAPDMMNQLVVIAQQGRSLGVFLLLSMQTTETLKGPIERNLRYRIALRMAQKGDSKELIGDEAAATINGRIKGRGYFKCDDELYLFQTARVMSRAIWAAINAAENDLDASTLMTISLIDSNWRPVSLLDNKSVKADYETPGIDTAPADVDLFVELCHEALLKMPLHKELFRPWLPPLPENIAITKLIPDVFSSTQHFLGWPARKRWLEVPVAVLDKYWEQNQPIIGTEFRQGNHLQFLGVQDSGRTSALLATLLALAATHNPDEISFVLIDYGSTINLFSKLPHPVDYFNPSQVKEIKQVLTDLARLLDARRTLFGGGPNGDGPRAANFTTYRELLLKQGTPTQDVPEAVIVAFDNYIAWAQSEPDMLSLRPTLTNLIQNGPTYGIYFVLTTDKATDIVGGSFIANFQSFYLRMEHSNLPVIPYDRKIFGVWQGKKGRALIPNTPPYNVIEAQCLSPVESEESEQLDTLRALLAEFALKKF